jgi:hypothetical protein
MGSNAVKPHVLNISAAVCTEAHEESESQWYESSSNGLRARSMLVVGGCQARADRLILRSGRVGAPGVGEYEREPPMMSTSCSCRTTEYLGSRKNLGTESLDINLNTEVWASSNRCTTSCRLLNMDSSSPTALVMRLARLLRRAWSMFSSHGEPGAKKALYNP